MAKGILKLEAVIAAWNNSLKHDRFLMSPSTIVIVVSTIAHLEELKATKQEPIYFRKQFTGYSVIEGLQIW